MAWSSRPQATVATAEPKRQRWPWWHERSTALRRTVRTTAVILGTGLLATVFGVWTAQFTGSLGPHVAQYSTTLNSEVRIDMGPLGAFIIDSPLPFGLGVDVVVQEIPDALSADEVNPVAGLTADLNSYTQFLTNPGAAVSAAAEGLGRDAIGRTVVAWGVLLTLIALARLASHGVLRKAVYSAWRQQGVPAITIGLVVALLVPAVWGATRGSGGVGRTSDVLADTPLAQARITGRLVSLVDFYGGYVIDAIRDNEAFYDQVEANLRDAYDADTEPLAPDGVPPVVPMLDPEPDSSTTADPAQPPDGSQSEPSPSAEPTESTEPT
ncbi:MAG: hypothetical protein ACK5H2_11940, partial [Beutenbergiaceae bacterium]